MKSIKELLQFSIINIDKPAGPTSFSVSQFVKKELGVSKTSHLGTLDPAVTGVLPVAVGRACRLNEFLMHRDKEYVGIMRLHENIDDKELKDKMQKFVGKIIQLPPVRSSVKRAEREREVKSFEILEREGKDVLFSCVVQAGTYIRKLIHDLGEGIGGAHMLELRRTRAGNFDEKNLVKLYDFENAVKDWKVGDEKKLRELLVPAEKILIKIMPKVEVKEESLKQLLTGKPLMKDDVNSKFPDKEIFSVFHREKFVGVYRAVKQGAIIGRAEFVFN